MIIIHGHGGRRGLDVLIFKPTQSPGSSWGDYYYTASRRSWLFDCVGRRPYNKYHPAGAERLQKQRMAYLLTKKGI